MNELKTADTTCRMSLHLPSENGRAPGPLYSLVVDESGNLYCSDEFNHSILSFDDRGKLRWKSGGQGCVQGKFWYPRGLSLGWTVVDGSPVRCLAVADAWNRRVQLLNENGAIICAWSQSGGRPFSEVNDVRFLSTSAAQGDGYWLVLDRGSHRLCALDRGGNSLFQIGRGAPDKYAELWNLGRIALLRRTLPAGAIPYWDPCDITYYPTRILGNSEEMLFISEPGSKKLKRVVGGNLLPVSVAASPDTWIGADMQRLLGSVNGRARYYDHSGNLQREIPLAGSVVPSNLPLDELWIQSGNRLERIRIESRVSEDFTGQPAGRECAVAPDRRIQEAADGVVRSLHSLISFAGEVAGQFEIAEIDSDGPAQARKRLDELRREIRDNRLAFCRLLHPRSVEVVIRCFQQAKQGGAWPHSKFDHVDTLDAVLDSFQGVFQMLGQAYTGFNRLHSGGFPQQAFKDVVTDLEEDFDEAMMWTCQWAYDLDDPHRALQIPPVSRPGHYIARPEECRSFSPRTICSHLSRPDRVARAPDGSVWFSDFQEKAIYRLTDGKPIRLHIPELLHPQGLLMTSDGLYVADRTGGAVWLLSDGKSPERVLAFPGEEVMAVAAHGADGPVCVAVYGQDRQAGRIVEFDREWKRIRGIELIDARAIGIPIDLSVRPDGNLALVEWGSPGGVSILSPAGELICRLVPPVHLLTAHSRALCSATRDDGSTFVSDHWFGCLWHFAPDFSFLGGLGQGILRTPAGLFMTDNTLIVADAMGGTIWEFTLARQSDGSRTGVQPAG